MEKLYEELNTLPDQILREPYRFRQYISLLGLSKDHLRMLVYMSGGIRVCPGYSLKSKKELYECLLRLGYQK